MSPQTAKRQVHVRTHCQERRPGQVRHLSAELCDLPPQAHDLGGLLLRSADTLATTALARQSAS